MSLSVWGQRDNNGPVNYILFGTVNTDDPQYQTVSYFSPGGSYMGSGNSSSGQYFSDFGLYTNALTGTWRLVFDDGLGTQKDYTFTLTTTLAETDFPDFGIDSPDPGVLGTNPPAFTWHGPANFTSMSYYAVLYAPPYTTLFDVTHYNGPTTDTSYPYATEIGPGEYLFHVDYALSGPFANFSISTPVDNESVPLANWSGSVDNLSEVAQTFFTADPVPEPATLALLGLGLPLLLKLRRRK